MLTVDFHFHSTASDGTLSPAELSLRSATFAAAALTDHDNCDGVREFVGGSKRHLAGIELSINPGKGFDKFHLLGIGIDPDNAQLQDFLQRVLSGRKARNQRIIANFRRLGIDMEAPSPIGETIYGYAHGEVLARPHFAKYLVDIGQSESVHSAFERYLLPDSPVLTRCYEERYHPSQDEAFAVIHAAGGLCIMAHPKYWRREWKTKGCDFAAAKRELRALKELGLDGVEALYQANTAEENVEFSRIADSLGLLKSAGSDFHGATKPDIPLGMEVETWFIAPLLERLGCR